MRSDALKLTLAAALLAGLYNAPSQAGGPLLVYEDQVPYRWDVSSPVPVYTDLGDLCDTDPEWPYYGCLSNEQANAAVAHGFSQWTGVASSSFQAEVVGDFADLGLGDITGANAHQVIGAYNDGGYHVVYDSDGSVIRDFFGAPEGVLGISSPEWAEDEIITESWAVINVASVPEGDYGTKAAGVMTHEFGHGIGLAHSQANGHITFYGAPWYWIPWAAKGCPAPYNVDPIEDWAEYNAWIDNVAIPNTETMYPFIAPEYTGEAMSKVKRPDDIASLSNLYPGPGWPHDYGTISGRILLKDGQTGLTGVNVVARNVADPLGDVVTVLSGNRSQGMFGPDGRFTINGLTPGAEYIVYVEGIVAGGFSTPPATLPTFAEYWNGAGESGNAATDDPCQWSTIVATAGSSHDASIVFNGIDRAPGMTLFPVPAATDVDNSGQIITGSYGGQIGWFYNTRTAEFELFESVMAPKLANDNKTVIAALPPSIPVWEDGIYMPGLWSRTKGWQLIDDLPLEEPGCDGWIFSPYDLSGRADQIVGLGYRNGCPSVQYSEDWTEILSINKHWAAVWDSKAGIRYLETPDWVLPDFENCQLNVASGCQVRGTRANAISGDGKLVGGHVSVVTGYWLGAVWIDGKLTMLGEDDPKGWLGSVNAINKDGTAVVGGLAGADEWNWGRDAYLWSPTGGTTNLGHMTLPCELVAPWDCDWQPSIVFPGEAFGVSDKGDLVVGRAGDYWNGFIGFLWTEATGMLDFGEFLRNQGVMEAFNNDLVSPLAVSGDGKTIVGWGFGETSQVSFAVTLDQVWVCNGRSKSQLVGFPGAMAAQLANGASLGLCEADRPIAP